MSNTHGTTLSCTYCRRPVLSDLVYGLLGEPYHRTCTIPQTWPPIAEQRKESSIAGAVPIPTLTKGEVRKIVNEELNKRKNNISPMPKIGEYWPGQGGSLAGLMRGENGPDYWLIVPADKAADLGELEYGSYGENEPGAMSMTDGLANTRALVESKHSHPAAEACAGLVLDGHSDLYLPAIRELALARANVPELFNKVWHWSSTQYSADDAWVQSFLNGYQYYYHKDDKYRVRAVRRVSDLTV